MKKILFAMVFFLAGCSNTNGHHYVVHMYDGKKLDLYHSECHVYINKNDMIIFQCSDSVGGVIFEAPYEKVKAFDQLSFIYKYGIQLFYYCGKDGRDHYAYSVVV